MSEYSPEYYRDKADYLELMQNDDVIEDIQNRHAIILTSLSINGGSYKTLETSYGHILTMEELLRLKASTKTFYETFSDEEIQDINFQLYHQRRESERIADQRWREKEEARREQKRQGKHGYVYLIKAELTNTYKIGLSDNPKRRLWQLQGQADEPLTLTHTIETPDMYRTEKTLHTKYGKQRLRKGEWFHLSDEDVKEIMISNAERLFEGRI